MLFCRKKFSWNPKRSNFGMTFDRDLEHDFLLRKRQKFSPQIFVFSTMRQYVTRTLITIKLT